MPSVSREPKSMQIKIKILHLSAVKNWGGGEKHIQNLCLELQQLAPEVENIIFCKKNSQFHSVLKTFPTGVIPAILDFKLDPRYFLKVIRICKEKNIDLLHIHDSTALALAIVADHLEKLPPFIFSKKTSFPIQARKSSLYKYNYPKIKKILCVSEATKAVTIKNINEKNKVIRIYHGTSLNDKSIDREFSIRKDLNLGPETNVIGNIANHIWPKNLETFVLVADELINNRGYKNLHFIQIGAFSEISVTLQKMIKKLDLDPYITLMDQIANASGLIPQFDISLMTSESEGIPQFIYESFYHKIPVVSTNVGGISEVIKNNENGFLAPAFDYKLLADHIITLTKNPELKVKFAEISNASIYSNFNSELMAKQTLTEYKKILNGSAKTGN